MEFTLQHSELLNSLADTTYKTRVEIDAMRTVVFAVVDVLSTDPLLMQKFVNSLQANIDKNEAIILGSSMSDSMIQDQSVFLRKFLSTQMQQMLRLP